MSDWKKFGDQSWYDEQYFEADKAGGKEYKRPDGSTGRWGYFARQEWSGWTGVIQPLITLFRPQKVLDVGCGCGSFVVMARRNHLKCWGIDYSEWAINHPIQGAEKWISLGDARAIPYGDNQFDFVFASDLMEHIYRDDVDTVINELYRVSSKWIFLQIATVGMKDKPFEGYFLERDQPTPLELEVFAVAGHVTVQTQDWWMQSLDRQGMRSRPDMVDKFRRLVKPPDLIQNWQTIIVMEKKR